MWFEETDDEEAEMLVARGRACEAVASRACARDGARERFGGIDIVRTGPSPIDCFAGEIIGGRPECGKRLHLTGKRRSLTGGQEFR